MRKQETHNFGRFGYRMTQCARTLNYIGFLLFYSFYVYLVSFRLYFIFRSKTDSGSVLDDIGFNTVR